MRERLTDLNRVLKDHPLTSFVDLSKPGQLGIAVSDYIDPEVYRKSEFNRVIKGEDLASDDSLLGQLLTCHGRFCLLVGCRCHGVFSEAQREVFDTVLFIARAMLQKMACGNVEAQVTKFLMMAGERHPNAFFIVKNEVDVLPVNSDAVSFSECFWGEDDAVRVMSPEMVDYLRGALDASWTDPVTSAFQELEMDLGKGLSKVYAMYKPDGEALLVLPNPGKEKAEAAAERLAAILTRRQREIMEWIAEGKTSAEVAIILDISPRTVEKHLEAVFQRLGVENRIAAVRRYLDLKAGQPV